MVAIGRPAGQTSPFAIHWSFEPSVDFLNHGAFGACPRPVLEAQRRWRDRVEAAPVRFLDRELEGHLDRARRELGTFVGADADDLAFVANATTGVNTVLRSLRFAPGDELLATDHEYNAVLNALRETAARDGARVVIARIPFPLSGPGAVLDAITSAVTSRTRLVVVSHVTSPTALVLPVAELVRELRPRGVDVLVDGAHAPGMVPLDLDTMGAAYYAGNGHKWLCAPKGVGFLHVRRDLRDPIRPLVISHGANSGRQDRTRYRLEFDWVGTPDPTGALAVPDAIRFVGGLLPGGWPAVMAANHALAIRARDLLCSVLESSPPAPDEMIGAMASVPLPRESTLLADRSVQRDPLQRALDERFAIEVPVIRWPVDAALEPGSPARLRLIRASAQLYNDVAQFERLVDALAVLVRP